ncbi:MAG: acyl-CoA dehydrogenase C-terminal domain-containing protein, partial [Propionibacteriales bacterium]|nr:acyl-CoA dehydrogenase C-terminal domain-containing protein [Propionibacteriales bacterium]
FFFRKIVRDNGQALGHVSGQIAAWIGADADGQLKEERKLLQRGLEDAGTMVGLLVQQLQSSVPGAPEGDPRNVYKVGLNTSRVLMALGDVVVGWLLLRGAEVALDKLNGEVSSADQAFYTGKVAAARWFANTVLPKLTAERKIAERTTLEVMDLPEEAF